MSLSQLNHTMYLSNTTISHWENLGFISSPQSASFMIKRHDGTNELVIPQKTLPYIFGEQVLGPMLDKILETAKKVDSFVFKLFSFLPVAKADDTGLIGYFEGPCPDGWEDYTKSGCRTIIASGTTTDSRGETRTCQLNEQDGEFQHQQTTSEMAVNPWEHAWAPPPFSESSYRIGIKGTGLAFRNLKQPATKGHPHNNMQPYFVLNACKKTATDSYASQADLNSVKSEMSKLYSEVNSLRLKINSGGKEEIGTLLRSDVKKPESNSCDT